jgi:hypothetical protein
MIFGACKSRDVSFCSIECARHHGCEPTRLFLNGEQIGEVCAGCGIELDTAEYPTPASVDDGPLSHPVCSICRRRHGREVEHPCE